MTTTIYVLRLEGGHYYIGKSDNVIARYQQHLDGKGSAWTKLHKPVSLVKTVEGASPFDEDKITKEYMATYGIEKVRGGSYVQLELSPFHMDALHMEIRGATDVCTRCGRGGHFVKDCFLDESDSEDEDEDDSEDEDFSHLSIKEQMLLRSLEMELKKVTGMASSYEPMTGVCYRCGRAGHYASNCYATTYVGRK
jgi:predicted GIY-YIG superfamily endonuclease